MLKMGMFIIALVVSTQAAFAQTPPSAGGQIQQCGWLKDKYGLSWQVVPTILLQMLSDPDPRKSEGTMTAMLQMKKFDIDNLKRAHARAGQ